MRDIMGDPYEFEAMGDEFIPFFIELNHPFVVSTAIECVVDIITDPSTAGGPATRCTIEYGML